MKDEVLPFITAMGDRYYHRNLKGATYGRMLRDYEYWGDSLEHIQLEAFLPCSECCPDTMDEGERS